MSERSEGTIDFTYDAENDVVIATPRWSIENEDDVRVWYEQYAAYLSRFGRPMDVVFVLDHFVLKPAIGVFWGEYRARIHLEFTRFTYRVNTAYGVRLFSYTSGTRHKVSTGEAATIEEAIERIHEARREAGLV